MTVEMMRTSVHEVANAYRLLSQHGEAEGTPICGDSITRLRSDLRKCRQMPQTVSSFRNKLACEAHFLATEFDGAVHRDAQMAGGKVLAKAAFLYGTVKVAVIANKDGSIRTLAIALMSNGWERVRNEEVLKPFVEATIHRAVVGALQKEFRLKHGVSVTEAHLNDAGLIEKVTEGVLRGAQPWVVIRELMGGNKMTATVGAATV